MKRSEFFRKINRAFELLGNPLRMQIFLKVLNEGCDCNIKTQKGYTGNCVSGIVKELRIPQSTASTYLKDLEEGELIECEKNGKFVYCRPNKKMLTALKSFIDGSISQIRY